MRLICLYMPVLNILRHIHYPCIYDQYKMYTLEDNIAEATDQEEKAI